MLLSAGERAPAFRLRGTDNAYWILGEPDKRRSVLVVFFRREVATCRLLLPFIERLHRCPHEHESEILGISLDNQRDTIELAEDYPLTFPMLLEGTDLETVRAYGVTAVPTVFHLDRDLHVRDALAGWSREGFERLGGAHLEASGARERTVWEPIDAPPHSAPASSISGLGRNV